MKLAVIGNGFDLHHGLKTTLKNFLESSIIEEYKNNFFIKYYDKKLIRDEFSWIDFEVEISNILKYKDEISQNIRHGLAGESMMGLIVFDVDKYVNPNELFFYNVLCESKFLFFTKFNNYPLAIEEEYWTKWKHLLDEKLYKDYHEFKKVFNEYIEFVEMIMIGSELKLNKEIDKVVHEADEIICFNYTSTVDKYKLPQQLPSRVDNVKYVHNRVNEDIIIGIKELNEHNTEFNSKFYKTINYITTNNSRIEAFEEKNFEHMDVFNLDIYFIGHSFGESDHYLFIRLKSILHDNPHLRDKVFVHFFVHSEDSKKDFVYNLKQFFGSVDVDMMNDNGQIRFIKY
ncbi:hypothetical protein KQ51_01548 [Candidatus Izimaplasma bacterium HR1]|jgi:hypothetical protein|uniref:AbiH family protein n=1 Tax=Candidatus Izimoplasma sp. HR1 TaxID=1541959 RepID=UPI0004F587B6|nr:hypothetical protein KQ51_01548 [Candidatus Izimaplasma bacterium HR1]